MKILTFISILFCTIVMPVHAELTPEDLNKIRLIVNDSERRIKEEIRAEVKAELVNFEKSIKEYVDIRFESVDAQFEGIDKRFESVDQRFDSVGKQIEHVTYITYALIALIVAAIGIPQIIMMWRREIDRDQAKQIQELRQEIEVLKQHGIRP